MISFSRLDDVQWFIFQMSLPSPKDGCLLLCILHHITKPIIIAHYSLSYCEKVPGSAKNTRMYRPIV